jgi:hypothetical protein
MSTTVKQENSACKMIGGFLAIVFLLGLAFIAFSPTIIGGVVFLGSSAGSNSKPQPSAASASTNQPKVIEPTSVAKDDCVDIQQVRGFMQYFRNDVFPPELKVVGQVVHHCRKPVAIQLKITFRDSNGMVVDTGKGWTAPIGVDIEPDKITSFSVGVGAGWNSWSSYSVEIGEKYTWGRS